ncbi:GntR family transcriptional regulator [Methylobacterium sp. WSM2598]|uniref:GntR family transcriptional regulator n=1 Tax=Methylobacterium sp. WSM2598 TaxID=398261 RepID=UPI0003658127|nr:GntR family transcriptional regulator [Methylobacterium sp. WSM2598]
MTSTKRQRASAPAKGGPGKGRPSKGRGREFAYETLKRQIVSLQRAPGSELDELQLVGELGISRTPLREAFVQLASDGLVVLMPNRGARVAPLDLAYTQEHLEAFDLLQRVATAWAAARCSAEDLAGIRRRAEAFEAAWRDRDPTAMIDTNFAFHEAIGHACGNRNVARTYIGLLSENLRIARLAMAYECYGSADAYEAHIESIIREHGEMLDAIETRDAERAESVAGSHAGLARKRVIEYLSSSLVDGPIGRLLATAA